MMSDSASPPTYPQNSSSRSVQSSSSTASTPPDANALHVSAVAPLHESPRSATSVNEYF